MKQIKQQKSNTVKSIMLGVLVGALVTAILSYSVFHTSGSSMQNMSAGSSNINRNGNDKAENAEKTPAYWVAPMDANYRRDKPGKSPMGMDLVPFYENKGESEGRDEGTGTIKVSSNVIVY